MRATVFLLFALLALAFVAADEVVDEEDQDEASDHNARNTRASNLPAPPAGATELKKESTSRYFCATCSWCHCYSWGSVVCHWRRYGCFCHSHRKAPGGCYVYIRHGHHYHWIWASGGYGANCKCIHANTRKPVSAAARMP